MPKVVKLYWDYVPEWKGNADSPPEEQFCVKLKDAPEADRIELINKLSEIVPDIPQSELAEKLSLRDMATLSTKQYELMKEIVLQRVVRVVGLSVQLDENSKPIEITTGQEIVTHCPELAGEIAERILYGAKEKEGKESESPAGSTPKETTTSGDN